MITRRTKIQLAIFVLITLVGVSFTGARYAHLDRLVHATTYQVVAHFPDSGGIYQGGEVSYRGVKVGQVDRLKLTSQGVDVYLDIDKSQSSIPADTLAVVGNRSAVGEQYVELQPQRGEGPYLHEGSTIERKDTEIPISTKTLLTNLSNTVESVDKDALRTTVHELGLAFGGTGKDLQQLVQWMNDETWFTAAQAVEHGFASRLAPEDAPAPEDSAKRSWNLTSYDKVPKALTDAPPANEPDYAAMRAHAERRLRVLQIA